MSSSNSSESSQSNEESESIQENQTLRHRTRARSESGSETGSENQDFQQLNQDNNIKDNDLKKRKNSSDDEVNLSLQEKGIELEEITSTKNITSKADEITLQNYKEHIDHKEQERLRQIFISVDTDGSGAIDRDELNEAMNRLNTPLTSQQLDEMMTKLDLDGNGTIELEEFMIGYARFSQDYGLMAAFSTPEALPAFISVGEPDEIEDKSEEEEWWSPSSESKLAPMEKVAAKYFTRLARKDAIKAQVPDKRGMAVQRSNCDVFTNNENKGDIENFIPDTEVSIFPSEKKRKRANFIFNRTIFFSFMAGALSGTASAVAEILANEWWGDPPAFDSGENDKLARYWGFILGITLIATILEVTFIYVDALRSAAAMARLAGLQLMPLTKERAFVVESVVRSALEGGHPTTEAQGVNPLRDSSRARILFALLLWKGKTGITTFLIKLFVKRVLGRIVAKSALPLVVIPVTAVWNALVSWAVMTEIYICLVGPGFAVKICELYLNGVPSTAMFRRMMLRAVGVSIVEQKCRHPNTEIMLTYLRFRLGTQDEFQTDNKELFLEELHLLPTQHKLIVIRVLTFGLMMDGKFSSGERKFISSILKTHDFPTNTEPIERIGDYLMTGISIPVEDLKELYVEGSHVYSSEYLHRSRWSYFKRLWKRFLICITC